MVSSTLLGALIVGLGGLVMGGGVWPIKLLRAFKFEHWMFTAMLMGLVIMPWTIVLVGCPDAFAAYRSVDPSALLKSNLLAFGWGIANIMGSMCLVRIGVSLTNAIIAGLGVSVGVIIPMVLKGSGRFGDAPNLASNAGFIVLGGVLVMLFGVLLAALAGFGRDRVHRSKQKAQGNFTAGLTGAVAAGLLSCGSGLSFVYSQGPIVSAMKAHGAGDIPANFAVWAVGLLSGTVINIAYPSYLMTKNRNWGMLLRSPRDLGLAALIGIAFCCAVALMGKGMLVLGALGGSVGWGIYQATQMLGGQGVGFASGEWHGVHGKPRLQMVLAVVVLIIASVIMAYGNRMAKG